MLHLPLACMSAKIGNQIGSSVGHVVEVDTDDDGVGWGQFLRVKIRVDLTKPLLRGRQLKLQGVSMSVAFQYEWLPRFCFNYGVVKYGLLGCTKKSSSMVHRYKLENGPWLRALLLGRKFGGWNEGMKGRMGSAQSHNGGLYVTRRERKFTEDKTARGKKFSGDSSGMAGTPKGAKSAAEQPGDSSHTGENQMEIE